jgi:beta-fructofuranosidase
MMKNEKYGSKVFHEHFPETIFEQVIALKNNLLMQRFAESRKTYSCDPFRPAYHLVSPESTMNDPNGLCYWQGRWHLFYQAYPPEEFPDERALLQPRQHWGHAVSDDLAYWQDLPYALYPGIEQACFSGGTLVEDDRVIAFYPGIGAGQMVAVSKDPLLLNWEKTGESPFSFCGDSCIWKHEGTYYGILGSASRYEPGLVNDKSIIPYPIYTSANLVSSKDLIHWEEHGNFLERSPFNGPYDDGACPNFMPIGDKFIFMFFSHAHGAQYFLGDFDYSTLKFVPYYHGRFNHGSVVPGGIHAPTAFPDGMGGVYALFNINASDVTTGWDHLISLPMHLQLDEQKLLTITPAQSLSNLRGEKTEINDLALPPNEDVLLHGIEGNVVEYEAEIDLQSSNMVQISFLNSPHHEETTLLTYYNMNRKINLHYFKAGELVLDTSRSSTLKKLLLRPPECAELYLHRAENLKLSIFIDKSVVEIYANGKQYLASRVYPGRNDSLGVSVRAQGSPALIKSFKAWQMGQNPAAAQR